MTFDFCTVTKGHLSHISTSHPDESLPNSQWLNYLKGPNSLKEIVESCSVEKGVNIKYYHNEGNTVDYSCHIMHCMTGFSEILCLSMQIRHNLLMSRTEIGSKINTWMRNLDIFLWLWRHQQLEYTGCLQTFGIKLCLNVNWTSVPNLHLVLISWADVPAPCQTRRSSAHAPKRLQCMSTHWVSEARNQAQTHYFWHLSVWGQSPSPPHGPPSVTVPAHNTVWAISAKSKAY